MDYFRYRKLCGAGGLLFLLLLVASPCLAQDADFDSSRSKCAEGQTIHCLALGMEAEKSGDSGTALLYYRKACKSHSVAGGLRACTPLLSLANSLGRLDSEARFLEEKCEHGNAVTCYHLGKEYLKVRKYAEALQHLEPLCRQGFKPTDSHDLGPCFHLARSFHARKIYQEARTFYQLDCGVDIERVHPSCESLRNINLIFALTPEATVSRRTQVSVEDWAFYLLALIPALGVLIWFFCRSFGIWYLRWVSPLLFVAVGLTWFLYLNTGPVVPTEVVILFSGFITVCGLSLFSRKAPVPDKTKTPA